MKTGHSDRARYWRELRDALMRSKEADTADVRNSFLEQAGQWADRLAETADADGPEPDDSGYYIAEALHDIGDGDWAVPL